jgi:LEA14-like dessication related protein
MRPLLAAALAAISLAGCSSGSVGPVKFLEPHVDLRKVKVRSVGLSGGVLDLTLGIANPNHIKVNGTRLEAGLDLQDTHFGDIVLSDAFSLLANDTTMLTVPLTFRWSGVGAAARGILDYGEVSYGLRGTITVNTPVGAPLAVGFTGSGSIPLLH